MIKKCSWQGRKRFECFFVCVFQATQYEKLWERKCQNIVSRLKVRTNRLVFCFFQPCRNNDHLLSSGYSRKEGKKERKKERRKGSHDLNSEASERACMQSDVWCPRGCKVVFVPTLFQTFDQQWWCVFHGSSRSLRKRTSRKAQSHVVCFPLCAFVQCLWSRKVGWRVCPCSSPCLRWSYMPRGWECCVCIIVSCLRSDESCGKDDSITWDVGMRTWPLSRKREARLVMAGVEMEAEKLLLRS